MPCCGVCWTIQPVARWRLVVKDTGAGISAEDLGRLFLPFERLKQASGVRVPGTGLGLALSRRLTERMGGSVGVESSVGQGSTFWLELPSLGPNEEAAAN